MGVGGLVRIGKVGTMVLTCEEEEGEWGCF